MKETQKTMALLRQLAEAVTLRTMDNMSRYIKSMGLSMPQFSLLMFLKYGGGCGVHDIGTRMGITSAAASQLVDRLVQNGLVDRAEDPQDRRVRSIRLSDRGHEFLDKSLEERFRWVADLAGSLTAEEREAVGSALPVLIRAETRLPSIEHPHGAGKPAACIEPGGKL